MHTTTLVRAYSSRVVRVFCQLTMMPPEPPESFASAALSRAKLTFASADPICLDELDRVVMGTDAKSEAKNKKKTDGHGGRVRMRVDEGSRSWTVEWAIPRKAGIVCAGLGCIDMQLNQATGGDGGEAIETFQGETSIGGGSVSMACKTLARLTHGEPLQNEDRNGTGNYKQVNPPAVHSVIPLCKIGSDNTGDKLVSYLEGCGSACHNVNCKYTKLARDRDGDARTALAVLPIYLDGRRGCFFDAASCATFSTPQLEEMMTDLATDSSSSLVSDSTPFVGAFLFGYPHLLPMMQGEALASIFINAREFMDEGGVTTLDLNGVPDTGLAQRTTMVSVQDLKASPVLGPALSHVDILHMNEDELVNLTGCQIEGTDASHLEDEVNIASAISLFLMCGVAVVAVTRGKRGCFICCNDLDRFQRSPALPPSWVDSSTKLGVIELPPDTRINTNGAGDSFTSGLLVAALLRQTGAAESQPDSPNCLMTNPSLNLESAAQFATLVAAHHVDTSTRDLKHLDLGALIEKSLIVPQGQEES